MNNLNKFLRIAIVFGACILAEQLAWLFFTPVAYAGTDISADMITTDTYWDKSGNPYVLENDLQVPEGLSLTIGPGVILSGIGPQSISLAISGSLIIQGQSSDRTKINNLHFIKVLSGKLVMENCDLDKTQMYLNNSTVSIATSTIANATTPMYVFGGQVRIWGSRLINNKWGMEILDDGSQPYAEQPFVHLEPYFSIVNSSVVNRIEAFNNQAAYVVHAENNWWGSYNGPNSGPYWTHISGNVEYTPWLRAQPMFDPPNVPAAPVLSPCCSSILFLPGLEGTTLLRNESMPIGLGTTTNTLWPPNRNDDVRRLFLNENGSSSDGSIFSGDPISSVFGIYGIYGKFMDFLDDMVRGGTIKEWKSFGYDWRKPIAKVVAGPEQKASSTEYLVGDIVSLASTSKTGKVTLIAHSNGGLVAKYLVKSLTDIGKAGLIDKVISVAVPYLGTPESIGSILHGDDQSIGYGALLSKSVARQLGANMASAYSLLPSAMYFSQVFTPTIAFASTTIPDLNDGSYPQNIRSAQDQTAFIKGAANLRPVAAVRDLYTPIKGNELLIAAADILHGILDPFSWPATIARWAIVGWNKKTTAGEVYDTEIACSKLPCHHVITHAATTTRMGDGVVVAPSAAYNSGTIASADTRQLSADEQKEISHVNILETKAVQKTIESIIKQPGTSITGSGNDTSGFVLPSGMQWGLPDPDKSTPTIVLRTFSPVDLHVYDSDGNHTGVIPKPAQLTEVEDGLYTFYESKIPGSDISFVNGDDNDKNTQISLPDDGQYNILIQGAGNGTFSFAVERENGGNLSESRYYNNIPVTPLTVATTSVASIGIASSTEGLNVDFDGDGLSDAQITSTTTRNQGIDPVLYAESLKKVAAVILDDPEQLKSILSALDRIEKSLGKDKKIQAYRFIAGMEKHAEKTRKLTTDQKQQFLDMLQTFLTLYGNSVN